MICRARRVLCGCNDMSRRRLLSISSVIGGGRKMGLFPTLNQRVIEEQLVDSLVNLVSRLTYVGISRRSEAVV